MVNIYASPRACLQVWVPVFTHLHWDQAGFQALPPPLSPKPLPGDLWAPAGLYPESDFHHNRNDRDSWEKSNEMGLLPAPPRKLVIRSWRAFHQEPKRTAQTRSFISNRGWALNPADKRTAFCLCSTLLQLSLQPGLGRNVAIVLAQPPSTRVSAFASELGFTAPLSHGAGEECMKCALGGGSHC